MASTSTEASFRFDKQLLDYITSGRHDKATDMLNEHLCKESDDWGTLLHYAVLCNQYETARHLIELGSDIDCPTKILKKTPLMIAIEDNFGESARELLVSGANMFVKDAENVSVLEMALDVSNYNDQTVQAVIARLIEERMSTKEMVAKLLDANCTVYHAAILKNVNVVKTMLESGIDVNSEGYGGRTGLLLAVISDDLDMVKMLLENGANANSTDINGKRPLYCAARRTNAKIVEFLLKFGANPNSVDDQTNNTPLFAVFTKMSAENEKQSDECVQLLLRYGAELQAVDADFLTLFDHAISKHHFNKVKLLMSHLAIIEMKFNRAVVQQIMRCNVETYRSTLRNYHNYYEQCKQILMITVVGSLTLFSLLTHSDRKMRTYVRNETLDANLANIYSKHQLKEDYPLYYNIMTGRVLEANRMVQLENKAIPVICRIFNSSFEEARGEAVVVAENILKFLDEPDILMLSQV